MTNIFIISPSPHGKGQENVQSLMWNVILALSPAFLFSLYMFGIGALVTTLVSVGFCMLFEWIVTKIFLHQQHHLRDGSAILTGILLAFNLPSNISPFIVMVGAAVAIGVAKMSFGGLGMNLFNPALVGRVFLLISFPTQMTSWPVPIESRLQYLDAVTGATPMSHDMLGKVEIQDMLFGCTGGSLGEVAAIALILGGIYLIWRRVITWHIPVSIIATVFVLSCVAWGFDSGAVEVSRAHSRTGFLASILSAMSLSIDSGFNPLYQILGGGLMLGAIFMATDYVTSPMSSKGQIIYGIGIGLLTVIIRFWANYPEGMSFAILLMNAVTPLINKKFKPTRFGESK